MSDWSTISRDNLELVHSCVLLAMLHIYFVVCILSACEMCRVGLIVTPTLMLVHFLQVTQIDKLCISVILPMFSSIVKVGRCFVAVTKD